MQQYIEVLLKKINYPENKYSNFENAKLDKIVGNVNKTKYVFYITIDSMLKPIDYQEFCKLVSMSYSELSSVDIIFDCVNKSDDDIKAYYKLFIHKVSENSPLIANLGNLKIEVKENKLVVNALNLAQKLRFDNIANKVKLLYKKIGYDNLEIVVNALEDDEIQMEIANDMEISQAQVSRLEKNAIKQLKKTLR